MSWFSDLFGGGDEQQVQTTQNDIRQNPDYAEATQARQQLGQKTTEWGQDPNYGGISPDWNDIWENARQKVQRYFGGGPEGPGLNAQVKARSAARGVGDQAAGDAMFQRSGFQQGNMMYDMAVKQAIEKAQFGENARKSWMTSTANLAGMKPSFSNYGGTTTKESSGGGGGGIWDILGAFGGNAAEDNFGLPSEEESGSGGFDWARGLTDAGRVAGGDWTAIADLVSMFM